ncbi:MAG: hypothetical protein K2X81_19750, partial [Candidatus Obscuribacterales bacterium]|nr:hypothetical protein [Candidatus Obscuribacterales bacterium]
QGMMMPMGQGNSPQSKMGGMGQGMMMPMGQGSSPQSKMGGMPMGQTDSGAPGSTGMDEHAGHHNEGMSGDTAEPNSMQFPSSSLQDQVRIEELARKRINTASNMITEGVLVLSRAKESNDRRKVRDALRKIRYGVDEFESGLAAQEALEQGMAPRNIAIQWFKNELNLTTQTNHGDILGISWFHFFVMVALVFFAVIMIWMYFFKMRRAAEVLNHVAGSGKDAGGGKKKQDEK